MPDYQRLKKSPSGLFRWAARLPIVLFRARMGWLLFGRFILLTHIGRKTGEPRQVVLEVVHRDPDEKCIIVASGWGRNSDWFRNVSRTPDVHVTDGTRTEPGRARELSQAEAFSVISRYAVQHPFAFRELARFMISTVPETAEKSCRVISETIPFVALQLG